jgi:hypothetical protein
MAAAAPAVPEAINPHPRPNKNRLKLENKTCAPFIAQPDRSMSGIAKSMGAPGPSSAAAEGPGSLQDHTDYGCFPSGTTLASLLPDASTWNRL